MRRSLGIALVCVGLLIACIPHISAMIYSQKQAKLEEEWKISLSELASFDFDVSQFALDSVQKSLDRLTPIPKQEVVEVLKLEQPPVKKAIVKNMMGLLKIGSINLEVPILKGTTRANLNIAVTTVEPTGNLGEVGNFVLAGHNNHEYGRNFNRLGEVKLGDILEVQTANAVFSYVVTKIFYVNPNETWVLYGEKEKSMITLITCYPRRTAAQRLIVQGELQ